MITISETAAERLKEMLSEQEAPNMFLRLGVTAGGCSGFSYAMGFDDQETEADVYMDVQDLRIVVEKDDIKYLNGLEIDFEESGMTGGFTIHNPNATVTCGCGASFRTATDAGKPSEEPC
ncbi:MULTISPECIES: HesB/IscA family protein [Paenibacillus]|uniref:Iron-sulfur cluster assembly accessory protein n=1 Tax=Paenibacillus campinasensis TaxID=66347 RepID=A0A268EXU8_9BACL|nr:MULTISPECIES: iron-sulfur cluster assembly accessory protein [Paenibacillus]MUG66483.1 iron-sulfur cluster assembly accessory protein [Paenibacillus campinasensis]PAD77951.1 iron-sulfur cluster assembly accessory protein [Paenibacillus campinasensis]PAK52967.1 iron-sulfur cluster assembly accessory protein [Paenibacillus sp. 7541]